MTTFFRIFFCILSALCVAAVIPVAVLWGLYCLIPLFGAFLFGFLMLLAKRDWKIRTPRVERPSFLNTPEENERIRRETAQRTDDEA